MEESRDTWTQNDAATASTHTAEATASTASDADVAMAAEEPASANHSGCEDKSAGTAAVEPVEAEIVAPMVEAPEALAQAETDEPAEPDAAESFAEPAAPVEPEPNALATPAPGAPDPDAALAHMGDTQPSQPVSSTLPLPDVYELPVEEAAPTDLATNDPRLSDVGATFAAWARGRSRAAQTWFGAHRMVLFALVLVALAAVFALTMLASRAAQMPDDAQITQDAHEQLVAPAHAPSPYTDDAPLTLQALDITSKHRSPTRDDACDVDVTCTFANDSLQTTAEGTLTYVRQGDEWLCIAAGTTGASHHATAGVSHDLALQHVDELLQAADTSSDGSESLGSLYRNATVQVEGENFNEEAQTDALTLHLSKPGTFVSYECRLAAHFRFAEASGAWELVEVHASDGARDLGFSPLVGTWQGTFRTQQQSEGGKCLAASQAGLTVTITSANAGDDGKVLLEGTLSGVAHLHPAPADDVQSSEGDFALSEVPFTGSLTSDDAQQSAGLVFTCTTQDQAGGQVTLTLEFGSATAPDAATATLESTHPFEDTFLLIVPYQREVRYIDTFTLVKAS